ncbi:protein DEHYDRATION-INDUCED 19 homolog 3 isoform X2 [Morus notabilis]|uniref:protein DEHYDRATION-INDUCED 19 homolog 3 isoform X2 n=1 Tax=Morus notabilis TaxID=981085 RepID=UPI000CED5D0D|nr:protein DEHYDRATION-INDUCED 19 homolog 3 isoform X2 [Morus notabilis]
MEHDGWSFAGLSAASLRSTYHHHQSTLKSHSDFYIEFEDFDGDDEDLRLDFPCPFCSEDFDLVGLCCHLDEEHPSEAKSGICPVCATRVGMNMVGHITTQHVNFFKNLKPHKGECLALSFSRKELQDEHFRSIFGGSPSPVSTSKMALDPLLSFLHKAPTSEKSDDLQSISSAEVVLEEKTSEEASLEGNSRPPPLSDKDQEEKAERCKFVQGLLWSTFLDDGL